MVDITLDIRTVSEANNSDHWAKKSKRHRTQKIFVKLALRKYPVSLPCTVTLTRIAPRRLDSHDNLASSFKYIADAIAEHLNPGHQPGMADNHPGIDWVYKQKSGQPRTYQIRIQITER